MRSALPPRTLAGFIVAVIAVVAIMVMTYRGLEQHNDGVEEMTRTLETTRQVRRVHLTALEAESAQRGYLMTGDASYLEPYQRAVNAMPLELAATRRLIVGDAGQVERMKQLEAAIADKLGELDETVELARGGRTAEALAIGRTDRGVRSMDRVRTLVEGMQAVERTAFAANERAWAQASADASTISWAGSALLVLLIAAAAAMSARDFRLQQVKAWLRTGENELHDRMTGEHSAEQLGDRVIAFLAEYLGAQVGVVHVTDRNGAVRRAGSFAAPADRTGAPEGAAAGLTRQVLGSGKLLHVDDVPADYWPVSSGLGAGRPRHLVLAPATVEGKPTAVLELGFFRPPTAADLELLRDVSETIGVAFRSARYREELLEMLEQTQRQAEELQSQQEELRVSNEELEAQGRALQLSQTQLGNQQAELEQINTQLEEQMQSLARQRDDYARAQTDLQRANDYKSEFLANMSHELRTPLNSSLILAKLLADNREGNLTAEQVDFARTIYNAGNDLLALINDILDLSKIEAGKLDVRPENVLLARLRDDLRATFEPFAREKQLQLAFELAPDLPPAIHTDGTRLQQILRNLLSNALKFTERGGVTLRIQRDAGGGGITFAVVDTGVGIPPDQHGVIFEAFRQADGTSNRKHGGTGLGLSISRDLARLLGGELTLESEPGRGSTFTLRLPERTTPALAAGPVPERRNKLPSGRNPALPSGRHPALIAPGTGPQRAITVEPIPRGLLIIEDDAAFARILEDLARELDFRPLVAETAEAGLALAQRHRPSAIVLDVGLPDRSGLSVLDALKHDPATRHIPVHMMSVMDHAHAALEMGAAGYAIKPVKREELVDALRGLEDKFTRRVRRVLVVEDDARHRASTCRLLAGDDVETVAAATAAEALEQLTTSTFDCMVLDLSLPDRSGFELLEEMSQKESSSFPPVIVYTGRALSRDDEQRLRRYSSAIVIKGARSPERLLDEVTLFLHQVESELPADRQRMLRDARNRETVFEGRRVLIVEDDVRNIFALSSVLEPKGAKVEIARNGKEALAHLRERPGVDLVLMDIMMPEMDGLEATREIRKHPELKRLPIIALTAKAMLDDRESCLAAGANDYIAKPLDVDKLLSLARVWMAK